MENEGEQKLGAAVAGEDGGVGKEGKKRKQATGAEEVEEEPTDAKKMKLEGERDGEGEEGLKQEAEEQVCEEEKKEVKLPEESDEVEEKEKEEETNGTKETDGPQPKLGTVADDGGFGIPFKKKPYEHKFHYQEDKLLYEGQYDTTKDRKSNFRLNVEIHLDSGKVLLSLVLQPIPGSSPPPSTPYEFQVALVGEEGEDKGGCAMSVLSPQENEDPRVERKELVGDPVLEFLRQRCGDEKEIVFRVEELASE